MSDVLKPLTDSQFLAIQKAAKHVDISENPHVLFEGDWGNWNYLYGEIQKAAPTVEPVVPLSEVLELLETIRKQDPAIRWGGGLYYQGKRAMLHHLKLQLKQKYGVSE
jgi:hypothetical protein